MTLKYWLISLYKFTFSSTETCQHSLSFSILIWLFFLSIRKCWGITCSFLFTEAKRKRCAFYFLQQTNYNISQLSLSSGVIFFREICWFDKSNVLWVETFSIIQSQKQINVLIGVKMYFFTNIHRWRM